MVKIVKISLTYIIHFKVSRYSLCHRNVICWATLYFANLSYSKWTMSLKSCICRSSSLANIVYNIKCPSLNHLMHSLVNFSLSKEKYDTELQNVKNIATCNVYHPILISKLVNHFKCKKYNVKKIQSTRLNLVTQKAISDNLV